MLISKFGNGSEELVREFEHKYGIVLDEDTAYLVKGRISGIFMGKMPGI